MKKTIFIFILLCNQIFADDNLFIEANKQYSEEKYLAAISIYDSIISNKLESSELYYNLGNCYYKLKDWPHAIWYYKKSLSLKPNNKEAYHNLVITKLKTINQIEEIPQLFYQKWREKILNILPIKSWQIITLICVWIAVIIQMLNISTKYNTKYLASIFNIFSLILIITTFQAYQKNYNKNEAIIFSSSTIVNSAPSYSGSNLFSLHAGNEIEIVDQIDGWVKIQTSDRRNGWIKKADCKTIQ